MDVIEGLVGRTVEREAIRALVAPGRDGDAVLALTGHPGSGRTTLINFACREATSAGRRVMSVRGIAGESRFPLAGLSHLLLPFADLIGTLPEAHRIALQRPLGLVSDDAPFDLVRTGMAILALVTLRPENPDILVTVDDADFVDSETIAVLAFVARRMSRERAVLLVTSEPHAMPPQFGHDIASLRIGRLTSTESAQLLERFAGRLPGSLRQRIIAQSAGSPLALLETAAAAGAFQRVRRPSWEPLRVGEVIERRVMTRYRMLPEDTQQLLVGAAIIESSGLTGGRTIPVPQSDLYRLEPAAEQGIVHIDRLGVRFVHPAFWIAALHATPFTARVEAHRKAAELLHDSEPQRAWHLGQATLDADADVASLLQRNANEIGRIAGRLAKALALERAAELSPDLDDRARLLVSAAGTAAPTGEMAWVEELNARALGCVRDPGLRLRAIANAAWAAAAQGRFNQAIAGLSAAAAAAAKDAPEAAWEVLSIAAAVGYQSGSRSMHSQMNAVIGRLVADKPPSSVHAAARALWVQSYLHPAAGTAERVLTLQRLVSESPTDEPTLSRLAGAAWLDDESETAFDQAISAFPRLVEQGSHAAAAVIGPILSFASWDVGRWDDAVAYGARTTTEAEAAGGGMLQTTGDAVAALVAAARGQTQPVETHATNALNLIQGEECLSIVVRAAQARGISALGSGRYDDAYASFSRMFSEDGAPLHFHVSYFGIADLAAAWARSEQPQAGREFIAAILDGLGAEPARRLELLALRAKALLATSDDETEELFATAYSDTAGSRWPFERAQLLLDYGSWLRRHKRVNEAKPLLAKARDMFDSLGAAPWQSRVEGELRASHVDLARPAGSLDELTDQQREIVLLAGKGLTNREIAARMYLSPRTVASHLYRSFPKLGIRDRWQLRDLIESDVRGSDPASASDTTTSVT